jgi:hypothetical protein
MAEGTYWGLVGACVGLIFVLRTLALYFEKDEP